MRRSLPARDSVSRIIGGFWRSGWGEGVLGREGNGGFSRVRFAAPAFQQAAALFGDGLDHADAIQPGHIQIEACGELRGIALQ